jgi:hypothetical protein
MKSIAQMIPWLIAMTCVVLCDLVTGVRRALLAHERVRFSRAWRATMGKMVTYFAFVVMVVMVNRAAGGTMHIDRWACLLVCAIEGCSIVSNLLQPKGYNLDLIAALALLGKKLFGTDKQEVKEVIQKRKEAAYDA